MSSHARAKEPGSEFNSNMREMEGGGVAGTFLSVSDASIISLCVAVCSGCSGFLLQFQKTRKCSREPWAIK